ncbi:hypothetical protein NEF87_002124 [Candidatus Lokiarchaeum ossiferum]|uniref:tRNA/rRNA methyltransferase SpoU type domain-containing protein n=1 Tax=Candidatus Lokiarchaeum ossiferum TaxID=2951803 RepID=A0ABY6HTR1_9ARCH|nr:hypothetical protein NEF87_002124 [Candidatus Lokiarchaeum sp. B-35]
MKNIDATSPPSQQQNPLLEEFESVDITIILINTESSGNIGSVARVMKNFGFFKLILFNPQDDPFQTYAHGFAMKAQDVLNDAEVISCEKDDEFTELKVLFQRFDVVIGSSAKGYSYQNIKRIPIFLEDLDLSILHATSKVAIVFGRESTGLSNEQILQTDFLIKIGANPEYPTLNLSHAVAVVLYFLYQSMHEVRHAQVIPGNKKDKDRLIMIMEKVLKKIPLQSYRYERTLHAFKNIIGRSFASRKELNYIFNFFHKTDVLVKNPDILKELSNNTKENE